MIGFRGFNQTVNNRTGLDAVNRINNMPVGAAYGERTDCPFGCGIINRNSSVLYHLTPRFICLKNIMRTKLLPQPVIYQT